MSEEKNQEFISLFNGVSVSKSFEIAKYIDKLIEQEKRKEATNFLVWCRKIDNGDHLVAPKGWFRMCSDQKYDLYKESLSSIALSR